MHHVAIGFSNCLGNFVLMSAAVKILRNRGVSKIDLITDKKSLDQSPALQDLSSIIFDHICEDDYCLADYDHVYVARWSVPICMVDRKDATLQPVIWSRSKQAGFHELYLYLDMIKASPKEFDGFLIPMGRDLPIIKALEGSTIITLADASAQNGSKRGTHVGWPGFPELSKILVDLGYKVVLIGLQGELIGCEGLDLTGKLTIKEAISAIRQSNMLISTDTGLMHIADAMKTPVVLIMGPTPVTKSHPIQAPYSVVRKTIGCAPCFQTAFWNSCKDRECLSQIMPLDVLPHVYKFDYRLKKRTIVSSKNVFVSEWSKRSIFRFDFSKMGEIIYDISNDMIGDLIGSLTILKWIKSQYPEIKISIYKPVSSRRKFTDWYAKLDISKWMDLEIDQIYTSTPKGKKVFSSIEDFYIWTDLLSLEEKQFYPSLKSSSNGHRPELPDKYVVVHILQTTMTGERSTKYVKRRSLDFNKYSEICLNLKRSGYNIVRVGASYDSYKLIPGIYDYSQDNLSLDDTFNIISHSQLFIGGDTGLKLAASAFGVPIIIEIDKESRSLNAMAGCHPDRTHIFPLGIEKNFILDKAKEVLESLC